MGIDWETLLDAEGKDIHNAYDTHVANVRISKNSLDD